MYEMAVLSLLSTVGAFHIFNLGADAANVLSDSLGTAKTSRGQEHGGRASTMECNWRRNISSELL